MIKLVKTVKLGVYDGYGSGVAKTLKSSSVDVIMQTILNNINSKKLITWYNASNATVTYINSKYTYSG